MESPVNINSFWASLMVEELVRNGIDYFCMAPGSRCTPLTVAVAEHQDTVTSIHCDERGVAFHALGYGRATGKPAVVITTSGTAVSNCMPAVMEAAMEHIPMLLVTADRPPELRNAGANQTIDQVKFFGGYVRWFVDMPCPDTLIPPQMVLTTVDQAVYRCCWPEGGPVHLNTMFREPLAPEPAASLRENSAADLEQAVGAVDSWHRKATPYTTYLTPQRTVTDGSVETFVQRIAPVDRGLVVVGGLRNLEERKAVAGLVEVLGWPVCADITSGLRTGDLSGTVVGHHDVLMKDHGFANAHRPETILHIGGRVVSKQLAQFVVESTPSDTILVTTHSQGQDPDHRVALRIEVDLPSFCQAYITATTQRPRGPWLSSWRKTSETAHHALAEYVDGCDALSEAAVSYLLSRHIPTPHILFLASSMPVRDMDIFADPNGPAVVVGANRGASGIDGTIASATGFAAGFKCPITVLVGDLALLHDLNALDFLRRSHDPCVLIVLNNNGGGIFSFLPIARFEEFLEPYFVTPHGLSFKHVADMYGLSYHCPHTCQDFVDAYQKAVNRDTSSIVEVQIDREDNVRVHNEVIQYMQKAIAHAP